MGIGLYILVGHEPCKCEDTLEWARWLETADRRVMNDSIGEASVSTVFTGLDHNFGVGAPVLFETMVFGGPVDGEMNRYCTWQAAEKGHAAMVERVRNTPDEAS